MDACHGEDAGEAEEAEGFAVVLAEDPQVLRIDDAVLVDVAEHPGGLLDEPDADADVVPVDVGCTSVQSDCVSRGIDPSQAKLEGWLGVPNLVGFNQP